MTSRETLNYISPRNVNPETIMNLPEGVTLLSNTPVPSSSTHQRFVNLTTNRDYFRGREDSIHGVHFADMEVFNNDNDSSTVQPVAIKPVFSPKGAVHEYRASEYLNLGDQLSFRHLGFTRWKGNFNTITEFDQGVVSYDNALLNREHRPDEQTVSEALTVAAKTLILLNERGLVHRDFQVKNTASDVTKKARIIDLTTIRKISDPDQIYDNMSTYIESLTMFGQRLSPVTPGEFDEYFLQTYIEELPNMFTKRMRVEVKMAITALRGGIIDSMLGLYLPEK